MAAVFPTISLTAATLILGLCAPPQALGQIGGRASGSGVVVCPGGFYGGAHPFGEHGYGGAGYYGFFRRYWAYGSYGPSYRYGPTDGTAGFPPGCGLVYATPSHGTGCCGPDGAGPSLPPFPASWAYSEFPPPPMNSADGKQAATPRQAENLPPVDDTAHLQVIVPKDAEVLFDGHKTDQTGPIRELVSPPLTPGKGATHKLAVRFTDAKGKKIDEQHSIRLYANDRLRIDFTRPRPEQLVAPKPSP